MQTEVTIKQVLLRLGLKGDGVGGTVGIRHTDAISDLEGASYVKGIRIKEINLPDVLCEVDVEMPGEPPVQMEWNTHYENLVPVQQPGATDKDREDKHPLEKAIGPQMLRINDIHADTIFQRWAAAQLKALLLQSAANQLMGDDAIVECVLVDKPSATTPQVPHGGGGGASSLRRCTASSQV